ncbi:MAG: O-antigen ligase family protein [Acidobacteria bacterium]|nr:O-antigen ligase family protein [Acidobacteriota bacterium]
MTRASGPSPLDTRERTGLALFAGHLLGLFSIALSNILLGLSLLAAPFVLARRRVELSPSGRRWLWLLGLYVLMLCASTALSYQPRVSAKSLSDVFNLTTPLLAILLLRRERDVRRLVVGLVVLGALLALTGLVQYAVGYDDLDRRIRGSMSHYMTFSGVLLICNCLLLGWMAFGRGRRRVWAWLALLAISAAILVSYTRNAWVAMAVVLTVLALFRAPKLLLAYLPLGLVVLLLAPVPILQRAGSIFDLSDPSNYDRLCMAYAGVHMVSDRPLFGLGPDMVPQRYSIYRHPTAPRFWVPHLHNSFLTLAAERGLASLAIFLAMLGTSGWTTIRRLRAEGWRRSPRADLYFGVLLTLVAFVVAGLFEDNWADTEVQRLFLFVLVIPFCLTRPGAGSPEVEAAAGEAAMGAKPGGMMTLSEP